MIKYSIDNSKIFVKNLKNVKIRFINYNQNIALLKLQ